jgi:hypothetical protein
MIDFGVATSPQLRATGVDRAVRDGRLDGTFRSAPIPLPRVPAVLFPLPPGTTPKARRLRGLRAPLSGVSR